MMENKILKKKNMNLVTPQKITFVRDQMVHFNASTKHNSADAFSQEQNKYVSKAAKLRNYMINTRR